MNAGMIGNIRRRFVMLVAAAIVASAAFATPLLVDDVLNMNLTAKVFAGDPNMGGNGGTGGG